MDDNMLKRMNLDTLGIGASLICAVHCALFPLLVTLLPLLGADFMENETLEYGLMSFSFLIGCISLGRGYFRHHRRPTPLLLFITGFLLLLAGHFYFTGTYTAFAIILVGVASIMAAHLLNMRGCKQCTIHKHH
ncbi:MerC domain-containing protein [Chitinophaga polysaccharea]|uniref:MerC domain-containing protein n=1 Tax=Chitinophaga TaxID=79328 RepID=UPI0014559508|nr:MULTISPECIES: MerC domain-containing protein [Chitinophaga]NLR59628.1 MerC domain-containing protein [Chitinophaga polysaccharea]NLU93981.1 MerC domain-containing protein [Chitinophaga sp. Ak27]